MNIKPKHMHKGDIIRGLELLTEPYKVAGSRDLRADTKCIFCGKEESNRVLSEIKRRVSDGCGCQKSRKNSINWKSFKDWCIENNQEWILELWDYDLNTKNPDDVSYCTANKFYFKCPRGIHKSELWSPITLCRRERVRVFCTKCRSVAQKLIDEFGEDALEKYWDYENNVINPWSVPYGVHELMFFKCEKHGSFPMRPKVFIESVWKCSECAREQEESALQFKVNQYIVERYNFVVNHEYDCILQCINYNNGYILPYDNEIIYDNVKLIIEVNGIQHYKCCGLTKLVAKQMGVSVQKAFEYQQWRDTYKKDYAISQGYHYLAIPYWTEHDELYKTLIDNKIHEILTLTLQND